MIHRHLQVPPDTPVEELPLAAIADLLERGDLDDWKPVAAAIRRDPLGRFAKQVMHLVEAHLLYGVSPLWRSWIDRCRIRAERQAAPKRLPGLAALRRERGLTQTELASRLGISQSDLSKFERRQDVRLSTLRAYLEALGGKLRILFDAPADRIEIDWPRSLDLEAKRRSLTAEDAERRREDRGEGPKIAANAEGSEKKRGFGSFPCLSRKALWSTMG